MEKEDMGAHVMVPLQSLSLELSNGELVGGYDKDISALQEEISALRLKQRHLDRKRQEALDKLIDLKGSIRVFCRVRPLFQTNNLKTKSPITVEQEKIAVQSVGVKKEFSVDRVFDQESTQEDVFHEVKPILRSALDGHNVCILAYGQTGTGKTYTMEGTDGRLGIVPRAIQELFSHASDDSSSTYSFSISMLEVYLGSLRDLLAPRQPLLRSTECSTACNLSILATKTGAVEVEGLTDVPILDLKKANQWYCRGRRARSTSWTNVNDVSSRSHCLTRITIRRRGATEEISKLWLIDLGGSERLLKTGASGLTMDEGKAINLSLSALGDVIDDAMPRLGIGCRRAQGTPPSISAGDRSAAAATSPPAPAFAADQASWAAAARGPREPTAPEHQHPASTWRARTEERKRNKKKHLAQVPFEPCIKSRTTYPRAVRLYGLGYPTTHAPNRPHHPPRFPPSSGSRRPRAGSPRPNPPVVTAHVAALPPPTDFVHHRGLRRGRAGLLRREATWGEARVSIQPAVRGRSKLKGGRWFGGAVREAVMGLPAWAGMALGDPQADYGSLSAVGLLVALMCVCIVVGHLLEESRWMNESITALFIGLGTGAVILLASSGKHSRVLVFSEDLFFIYLLPPIIFNAGFQVKKKQFFRNFITITLFGAVGTLISFSVISLGALGLISRLNIGALELGDYLALGAIFSATDSVCTLQVLSQDETPFLYSLVFGEGVVNDATSIVLFNAIQNFDLGDVSTVKFLQFIGTFFYLFAASTILGVAAGLLSAYVIKKLYFGRHSTDREVSIMMLMAYLSYMISELLDLSGILTVFFCGIVMSHYTWHNVTESSRITTKHAFATMSFISETFLFLYVGMDALDIEKWTIVRQTYSPMKSVALSSTILALVLVARAAFVFPLSLLSNLTKKTPDGKISFKQQVIVWWAGLMRGAVSIALAYNKFTRSGHTQQPSNAIMITSTISVVLFSTIVFGLLTKPLIRLLIPSRHLSREPSALSEPSSPKSFFEHLAANCPDHPDLENGISIRRPASLRLLLVSPSRSVHHYWRKFDDGFMRPVFGGRGFVPFVPGSPTESSVPLLAGNGN